MSEAYDMHYGIGKDNKLTKAIFLDSLYHREDSPHELMGLRNRIEEFSKYNIVKYFGLSFTEFIDLPSFVCEMLIEEAREKKKEQDTHIKELQDELEEDL